MMITLNKNDSKKFKFKGEKFNLETPLLEELRLTIRQSK